MSEKAQKAFEIGKAAEGKDEATGEWMEVSQERINQFADVTEDHQFIHIDPERAAKESPFGKTIAHGFLTLSLLTHLDATAPRPSDPARYDGIIMGLNYGFDRVRFVSPVTVDSKVRAHIKLAKVELKGNSIQITRTMTVEIEGSEKPALVADWLTRMVFA